MQKVKQQLFYNGCTKEEWDLISELIHEDNRLRLNKLLVVVAIVYAILTPLSPFIPAYAGYLPLYLSGLICMVILIGLNRTVVRKKPELAPHLLSLFCLILMCDLMIIDSVLSPDSVSVAYVVVTIALPLLFTIPLISIIILLTSTDIVFLILCGLCKDPVCFGTDVTDVLLFLLISVFIARFNYRGRARAYLGALTIRQQQASIEQQNAALAEQMKMFSSLAGTFSSVHYVDYRTRTCRELNARDYIENVIGQSGNAVPMLEQMLQHLVRPESQDSMRRFTDMDTLEQRLSRVDSVTELFNSYHGWTRASWTVSDRNEDGSLKTLFFITRNADNEAEVRSLTELGIASRIQLSMLPEVTPPFTGGDSIEIAASSVPAKNVGGDFFDFFLVDENHLAIVMADGSDKGGPAALFMVIGKTLIKDHTVPGRDLGEVFTTVNRLLSESNSEMLFITAFEAVLDLRTGELEYVNAGHEKPFISYNGGPFQVQKVAPGFVLAGSDDTVYTSHKLQLNEGDKLFTYTDGATEAMNADCDLFGIERVEETLNGALMQSSAGVLSAMRDSISVFVSGAPQSDDLTMLCLEFKKKKC